MESMFDKPLATLSKGEAKKTLLKLIDNDEGVSEVEPLLFLLYDSNKHLEEQRGKAVGGEHCLGNLSLALAERAYGYLNKRFVYLLDVAECTPRQLHKKCKCIGRETVTDIMWVFENFDLHESGKERIFATMKPGKVPEKDI